MGLSACNARNAGVQKTRLKQFRKRIPRFRKLPGAGVDTAKLLRTGGVTSLAYGQFATGVAAIVLLDQKEGSGGSTCPPQAVWLARKSTWP